MKNAFSLEIDGASIKTGGVWCHEQREPYPGGHFYKFRASCRDFEQYLGYSKRELEIADEDTFRDFFAVQQLLNRHASDSGAPRFVLNTIESVNVSNEVVELTGECSPMCGTLPCPHCGETIWINWMFDHCTQSVPSESRLIFRCKYCQNETPVLIDGETISLISNEPARRDQPELKVTTTSDGMQIKLGRLRWNIPASGSVE